MNDQRKVIFEQRIELMRDEDVAETVADMRHAVIDDMVARTFRKTPIPSNGTRGPEESVQGIPLNLDLPVDDWARKKASPTRKCASASRGMPTKSWPAKVAKYGPEIMRYVEKSVLLQTLDHLWREHLVMLDHLRQVVGFRGYAQRDPLNEYKSEASSCSRPAQPPARRRHRANAARRNRQPAAAHAGASAHGSAPHQSGDRRRRDGDGRRGHGVSRNGGRCRRPKTRRSIDLGQGRPQRSLPLRLGQEIQALPRPLRLTDRARERQRASNADIIASLTQKERKQRAIRDIVDKAQDVRAQIATVSLQELSRNYGTSWDAIAAADSKREMALSQLRVAATDLSRLLIAEDRKQAADELVELARRYEFLTSDPGNPAKAEPDEGPRRVRTGQELSDWTERLITVHASEERALHEEVAQLVTYSVQANETERATQNVAVETLKLGQRTADAFARRDPIDASAILEESKTLSTTVEKLPISPLIQTEMIDALDQWRERLTTAIAGIRTQNEMIADMDKTATAMVESARALNDVFAEEASRIGRFVLTILLLGATGGLLLGSGTAFVVARSITRPLQTLQQDMVSLAGNPQVGSIRQTLRRDELGDMARAARFFVTELGHRERALREAKEKADAALAELQLTQAELIQSEKLASLGQLVAGVAHEINTPVGIALTTATTLGEEVRSFGELSASGQVPRARFVHFVERLKEGSQLLFANLTRAAELVHSFKQVAADQVSSERRSFDMAVWVQDLLTSLRPVLRKAPVYEVDVDCDPNLMADTYPGALAQVLTNLIMNALVHAYPNNTSGRMTLRIRARGPDTMVLTFADDGVGIAPEALPKVFDPFFTTARGRGNTGLGLHIAYILVTSVLQGRIEVASQPGKGTQFTIILPTRVGDTTPEKQLVSA
jgi:signal transduction histidine kinase